MSDVISSYGSIELQLILDAVVVTEEIVKEKDKLRLAKLRTNIYLGLKDMYRHGLGDHVYPSTMRSKAVAELAIMCEPIEA